MAFLLVADLLVEPELLDFEAEPPVFDVLLFAVLEFARAFVPASTAPAIAPPAAPVTIPIATSFKTLPAVATKPVDELFDEELDLAAGFLAEDDLLAVDDFVLEDFTPEDFADNFEAPFGDLLPAPDFEPAPDDLLVDDFAGVFELVAAELCAEDDFVPDDFEAVDLAPDFEAGEAEVDFLVPVDEDDLLAAALPVEAVDFAESLFDFVVAISLSLDYVKNVLKHTYERIFTLIKSVCQEVFYFIELFSKKI